MAIANRYVVLYFTNGPYPTADQMDEAREYGPHVMYRNLRYVGEGDACEPCTAVAGEVPSQYKAKFPKAVSYADWIAGKLPTPAVPPTFGEMALGQDRRSFADRVIPAGEERPKRSARAAAAAAMQPDPALTGTDTPPPPPPAPRGSLTGAIELPPPPPPPEG